MWSKIHEVRHIIPTGTKSILTSCINLFRTFKLQREWCKNELIALLIIHDAFLTFFLMIRLYSFKSTSNYRNFNKVQLIFLCLIHGSCRSRIWFTYQIKKNWWTVEIFQTYITCLHTCVRKHIWMFNLKLCYSW